LKRLARAQDLDVEIDAVGRDAAIHQRARAIIVPAREGELKPGHAGFPMTVLGEGV
jgi:hypothetical protein